MNQGFKACLGNIIRSRLKNKYMEVSWVPEWTVRKKKRLPLYISEGKGRGNPHPLLPWYVPRVFPFYFEIRSPSLRGDGLGEG